MTRNIPPRSSAIVRNSSIEMFRIIATISVLVTHFNGWFVGGLPDKLDFSTIDWHWVQIIIAAASCVCVNLFIIISGYFGLKLRISSLLHIGMLLLSIFLPLYVIGALADGTFTVAAMISQLFVISHGGYFVQCYIMLLFISPLLNLFVAHNSRRDILLWTFVLWAVEIWFGCIMEANALAFMNGYSVIHFVLIYMLARCVKLYQQELKHVNQWYWILGYSMCTVLLWAMYAIGIHWGYANPINIVSSFCLFLPFLYHTFYSKHINWVAQSTFAVYIIQVAYPVFGLLCGIDKHLLSSLPYALYLFATTGVIIVFFMLCIIYDKFIGLFTKPIELAVIRRIDTERCHKPLFQS